jgi:hypothetical protein
MSDLPDRSDVWLRILDSVLRSSPDLLGTNTVDDVVRMVDRFEDGHAERFSTSGYKHQGVYLVGNSDKFMDPAQDPAEPEEEEDEPSIQDIILAWKAKPEPTARLDCYNDLLSKGCTPEEAQEELTVLWPFSAGHGGVCAGCGQLVPASLKMVPSKTHGGKLVCSRCHQLDLTTQACDICAKWSVSPSSTSRLMCLKQLRRDLNLDLQGAKDIMDAHWPDKPDPGTMF